jgi:hypothetical protein
MFGIPEKASFGIEEEFLKIVGISRLARDFRKEEHWSSTEPHQKKHGRTQTGIPDC